MHMSGLRIAPGVLALLAPAVFYLWLAYAWDVGQLAWDVQRAFLPAAEAILDGDSPYPPTGDSSLAAGIAYVYPPLTALAFVPLTPLTVDVASVVAVVAMLGCLAVTLLVLGVRDARVYGIVLLWPSTFTAVQAANVTLPLALLCALAWRFRDRVRGAAAGLGLALAIKLIAWPLLVWLAATRRWKAAAGALGVAAVVTVVTWGAIGFDGVRRYPTLVRELTELEDQKAVSVYAIATDLGASETAAHALWLALAVAMLALVVVLGRAGHDASSFALAVAGAIACSPIVWLHYLAILVVPLAVRRPRLDVAWLLPLLAWPGAPASVAWEAALVLAVYAAVVALCVREPRTATLHERLPAPLGRHAARAS